jgi:hypothetical protein
MTRGIASYFQLEQAGTTIRREVLAGVTTFITMSYIIAINPAILKTAGIPEGPSMVATVMSAILGTLIVGLYANRPFEIAPYMGENAFVAYTVVKVLGYKWETVCDTGRRLRVGADHRRPDDDRANTENRLRRLHRADSSIHRDRAYEFHLQHRSWNHGRADPLSIIQAHSRAMARGPRRALDAIRAIDTFLHLLPIPIATITNCLSHSCTKYTKPN